MKPKIKVEKKGYNISLHHIPSDEKFKIRKRRERSPEREPVNIDREYGDPTIFDKYRDPHSGLVFKLTEVLFEKPPSQWVRLTLEYKSANFGHRKRVLYIKKSEVIKYGIEDKKSDE